MKNIKRILFIICSVLFLIVVSLSVFFTWKRINRKDFYDYKDKTTWISNAPFIELVLYDDKIENPPSLITGLMRIDNEEIEIFASTLNVANQIFIFSLENNFNGGQVYGNPIFEGTYEFEDEDFVIDVTKDHDNVLPEKLNRIYFTKLN